jgi:DNA polymerase-3 subunit alpha
MQIWDLAGARARFGRYLRVAVNGSVPPVADLLRDFPPRRRSTEQGELLQGLPVRLVLRRERAQGELDLGDDARFYPSDQALARWQAATHGQATVVYDTGGG